MAQKLTRDPDNGFLGGVAAGIARHYGLDPTLVRLAFILLVVFTGPGIVLFYLLCWVIIPGPEPGRAEPAAATPPGAGAEHASVEGGAGEPGAEAADAAGSAANSFVDEAREGAARFADEARKTAERVVREVRQAGEGVVQNLRRDSGKPGRGQLVAGLVLIVLGLLFLVDRFSWWYWPDWVSFANLWPIALIAIGIVIIFGATRGSGG